MIFILKDKMSKFRINTTIFMKKIRGLKFQII